MKFHIVDSKVMGDEFEIAVTEERDEALKIARDEWEGMTAHDKQNSNIEIRIYADEDEQTDYDEVDWWVWYAVMESDEDNDWGTGSYDLDEATEMLTPAGYIAVIDVRSDYCMDEIRFEYDSFRVSAVFEDGSTIDNDIVSETGADAVEKEIDLTREWYEGREPEYYIVNYYLDGRNVGEEEVR